MKNWRKDAWISIGVAVLAAVLFLLSMASMARLGQSTGDNLRERTTHGSGVPDALDETAAADTFRRDTTLTMAGDTSSVMPDGVAAVSFGSSASDTLPLFGRARPGPDGGVPVLCYHYLRRSPGVFRFIKVMLYVVLSLPTLDDNELWTLSEGAFEKQMRWLSENGYRTVTLDEIDAWQHGHGDLPEKAVAITFDDGDRSVRDYAQPILEKYGFTASYFVITRQVGQQWQGLDFLTWDELRAMAESGTFTIESHTHDLHYKVGDKHSAKPVFLAAHDGQFQFDGFPRYEDRLRDDLERSRRLIELKIGRAPGYLAWPYGHSEPAIDLLASEAGYRRTLLLEAGTNESFVPTGGDTVPRVDRIPMRRYTISARTSLRTFRQMITGTYVPPDAAY